MSDALDTTREFLSAHAPFDRLEADALEFLLPRLETRFYASGDRITDPDHGPAQRFHIIRQGRIRGETPSEDEQVSGKAWELIPGESFPIGALLGRRPVHTVHRALEDTICLELSVEDFDRLRSRSQVFNDFCSRRLASLLDRVHQGLLSQGMGNGGGGSGQLNTPLGARIAKEPVTCSPDTPLRTALTTMRDQRVGSIVAVDGAQRPVGIFTMTDLLGRVALQEVDLDTPLQEVMTPDPIALADSALGFEGIETMAEHGMKHICVVADGRLVGVLGERDLLTSNPLTLDRMVRGILRAEAVGTIADHLREVPRMIGAVISQGAEADQILRLITRINDHATRRVLALMRRQHDINGIDFTWLAFGSQAREEQALRTDQDNGILFQCKKGQEDATRERLLPFAQDVNKALDECGFDLCPGNIMAGNPECCLSGPEWDRRFSRWIEQGTPEHLLKSSIFFDLRTIDGDADPVESLRSQMLRKTAFNSRFRRQMAANQMSIRPPLGLFGEIRSGADGINIKLQGLTPFVDGARVMALAAELPATRSHERLDQAVASEVLRENDARDYHAALRYLQMLRLRTQQRALDAGREDSNRIRPEDLGTLEARVLKEAFRQARKLQGQLAVQYQL